MGLLVFFTVVKLGGLFKKWVPALKHLGTSYIKKSGSPSSSRSVSYFCSQTILLGTEGSNSGVGRGTASGREKQTASKFALCVYLRAGEERRRQESGLGGASCLESQGDQRDLQHYSIIQLGADLLGCRQWLEEEGHPGAE